MMKKYFIFLLMIVGNSTPLYSQHSAKLHIHVVAKEEIFHEGFIKSCHASTLVEMTPGIVMAA
jgi:hypothetical protein